MEEVAKGCPMIRMGVSAGVFLLVPTYPGSLGPKAVKRLCVRVRVRACVATYARCDEIFNIRLTANLSRNLAVNIFLNRLSFDRSMMVSLWSCFFHPPCICQ